MEIPAARHAACVRPEQSYAFGPVAPWMYGLPRWARANATALAAVPTVEVRGAAGAFLGTAFGAALGAALNGLTPPLVRPALTLHTGHAPGPCAARTFSAI